MVSLMITMIMMLVISMIVLGFAQISRREARQSLDRQLSTQAFLAAESGINDARQVLQSAVKTGVSPLPEKTVCDTNGVNVLYSTLTGTVDTSHGVSYSCLLINTRLDDIHQVVKVDDTSSMVPIHPESTGNPIKALHIKWSLADEQLMKDVDAATCHTGVQLFSAADNWPDKCYGVLRIDMVPTGDLSNLNRDTLLSQQRAFFLYPTKPGGPVTPVNYATHIGGVRPMNCTNDGCTVDITNIPTTSSTYAMRLSAIYLAGTVDITAEDTANKPMKLLDAQAQIDATGKAQDVLRRVQVRMSLTQNSSTPNYALQSGASICKRFATSATNFMIPSDIALTDPTNPMCVPTGGPEDPDPDSAAVEAYCDRADDPCGDSEKDPDKVPNYKVTLTNQSPISADKIDTCTWDMDDGKPHPELNDKSCHKGDELPFEYSSPSPPPKTCSEYLDRFTTKTPHNVVLTIILHNQQKVRSSPKTIYIPNNC